jgi:hypothetical protein
MEKKCSYCDDQKTYGSYDLCKSCIDEFINRTRYNRQKELCLKLRKQYVEPVPIYPEEAPDGYYIHVYGVGTRVCYTKQMRLFDLLSEETKLFELAFICSEDYQDEIENLEKIGLGLHAKILSNNKNSKLSCSL